LVQGKRCPGGVRRNGVGYLAVRKLQGNAGNAVAVEAAVGVRRGDLLSGGHIDVQRSGDLLCRVLTAAGGQG
ncbi:Transcriptional regulator, y4mF family, partial [Dysosmobacter welbionis]